MENLLTEIRNCKVCDKQLPLGANPVISVGKNSKIVIIGQAPGRIVHQTGIPWNDKSGDNLRNWMGIDRETFYDTSLISLMPMGFCFPGSATRGDLPPRTECAPLWHNRLLSELNKAEIVLLVGQYAQHYYLGSQNKNTLTETVRDFGSYLPKYFPLPHPSPRNNLWQAKNKWFVDEVLPMLKLKVASVLQR